MQRTQHLGQKRQDDRAEHRAEGRADAAEQREAQDGHRLVEPVFVRADEGGDIGAERAREPGEHGGGDQGREAVKRHVHAHDAGGGLVLAHRLHGAADARAADGHEHHERHGEAQIDQPRAALLRNAGKAERAAGRVGIEVEDAQHLAEADGGERQIDARQAQGGTPMSAAAKRRREHAAPQRHGEGRVELHGQQRRDIGADAHEGGLAERKLADGEHHIHAERQQAIDAHARR